MTLKVTEQHFPVMLFIIPTSKLLYEQKIKEFLSIN